MPQDGVMLAQTLTILALSTPFMSANFMMSRVFYANEDARTPFFIQLVLAIVNVVTAFAIQFLPFGQIIFAIALLYTGGNILSVIVSAVFLRRLLGHLDGPRIANAYIRMGYAALGSAAAGAVALWLLGSYTPDGFAWSSPIAALVSIIVVGPVMLAAYLLLLKIFRVTELSDLLQPLIGRLRRRSVVPQDAGTLPDGAAAAHPKPERATVSVDTGLIPRISGEFDAASFRAGPDLAEQDERSAHSGPDGGYLPAEDLPSTAEGGLSGDVPLPGRRTYQGPVGHNPYFPFGGRKKK
ncbi:lipid II flippase MurJ [Arthrobacter sp. H16F315]|uniref:lipid II flippase MurJ n=2 Tax=Arthrobacter sp. H16F315 TaxID=2955314 RepID=UPI0020973C39|nr:lipid II flippase MurJ [Arthrobacter sp. H16F315]